MQRLLDRNAMVTGAAQGMGLAIARALYREGARVLLMDVNEKAVVAAAREIDPSGARAVGRSGDVAKLDEVRALVKETEGALGDGRHPGEQCRRRASYAPCA